MDDDSVILQSTSLKLRAKGYAIITALDGSEAIGKVRDEKPDLVLLDLDFPPNVAEGGAVSWDGFAVMYWLGQLAESQGTPIIVITGSDTANVEAKSLKAGAMAYFQKPLDYEALLAAIGQTLGLEPPPRQTLGDEKEWAEQS